MLRLRATRSDLSSVRSTQIQRRDGEPRPSKPTPPIPRPKAVGRVASLLLSDRWP